MGSNLAYSHCYSDYYRKLAQCSGMLLRFVLHLSLFFVSCFFILHWWWCLQFLAQLYLSERMVSFLCMFNDLLVCYLETLCCQLWFLHHSCICTWLENWQLHENNEFLFNHHACLIAPGISGLDYHYVYMPHCIDVYISEYFVWYMHIYHNANYLGFGAHPKRTTSWQTKSS